MVQAVQQVALPQEMRVPCAALERECGRQPAVTHQGVDAKSAHWPFDRRALAKPARSFGEALTFGLCFAKAEPAAAGWHTLIEDADIGIDRLQSGIDIEHCLAHHVLGIESHFAVDRKTAPTQCVAGQRKVLKSPLRPVAAVTIGDPAGAAGQGNKLSPCHRIQSDCRLDRALRTG